MGQVGQGKVGLLILYLVQCGTPARKSPIGRPKLRWKD